MQTEFHDKSGNPIYIGDIVQYRLSLNSKHGGPSLLKVVRNKKGEVKLADPRTQDNVGWTLRKNYEQHLTIVDTSERSTK